MVHLLTSLYLFIFFKTDSGLRSDCAGNLMRLSLDKALAVGNQLEVEAISEYESCE